MIGWKTYEASWMAVDAYEGGQAWRLGKSDGHPLAGRRPSIPPESQIDARIVRDGVFEQIRRVESIEERINWGWEASRSISSCAGQEQTQQTGAGEIRFSQSPYVPV
jgi:hypothetical protein